MLVFFVAGDFASALAPRHPFACLIFSAQNPPAFQKNGAPSRFAGNAAFAC